MSMKRLHELEAKQAVQKPASMPQCSGCKLIPLPVMMHEINTPRGVILGLVCCAECGYVVQGLVVGIVDAQLVDGQGRPMLAKPQ